METSYSEYNAWLQTKKLSAVPIKIICDNAGDFVENECRRGLERLWGNIPDGDFSLILKKDLSFKTEEYSIFPINGGLTVAGGEKGLLFGVYRMLNLISAGLEIGKILESSLPKAEYRVINHWDNMDGSIERGYAGNSIFFADNAFSYDPARIEDYARLLSSCGINAVCINNVNVTKISARLVEEPLLSDVSNLAEIFRPFGIRLLLSVSFDAPVTVGGLPTPDPLDGNVKKWWNKTAENIYKKIPDFLGFVMKADSEFRDGPAAFGRTQADGANTLANAVKPFGGVVFWRCFIYNCRQDWRDVKTDRPMAAYNVFKPLDGKFDDNVILQIKFGPVDFQVREPLSPLFGALDNTNEAIEYQITQEYTGHQIDLYATAVQWEEINREPAHNGKTISEMFGNEIKATAGVSNIGSDSNWTGHTLAQCNLYSFGRMSWEPTLSARDVIAEWVALTFDTDFTVKEKISEIILASRAVYESYTSPLALGFMVAPHLHYGPSPEGYEFALWGTYHRANYIAIGVDRTSKGTGYAAQYPAAQRDIYDDINTCPEELLLFFHRVEYSHKLKDGRTLLQFIYDSHFEGAENTEKMLSDWLSLKNQIPESVYSSVAERMKSQLNNAREWRDIINTYFYRFTGIPDKRGRKIYD